MILVLVFDYFEFEVELFATENHREVELPELPGEAKRGPALVEIYNEFQPQRPPEIGQADVRRKRS